MNSKKRNINLVLEPNLMGSMADCTWHERKRKKARTSSPLSWIYGGKMLRGAEKATKTSSVSWEFGVYFGENTGRRRGD